MTLGKMGRCWSIPTLMLPRRATQVTTCCIHVQQQQHHRLLFHHFHTPSLSHCRHSSFIVKSPCKDIEIPNKLIPELFWDTVDRFSDSTAVKCGLTNRKYTFADIQKLSYRFANSLRQLGFNKGDILALVLPNCPEFLIIILGALEAGLSISFINHGYTADEICHQLSDSGSVCVVTAVDKLETVMTAVAKVENKAQSKIFKNIIAVDFSSQSLPSGVVRFNEMIGSNVDSTAKPSHTVGPNDLAFLPYSSGTTGLPKGVRLSHRNIVANIFQTNNIKGWKIKPPDEGQDTVLGILPFYHIFGLSVVLLGPLTHGGQVITLPKFEQDSFINTLANEKLSILMLVPPLILFIGNSDKITPKHLSHMRILLSGAAPLGASDLERLRRKLNTQPEPFLAQGYGMTETSPVALVPPLPSKDMASIGVPVANSYAKVIDPQTGEALGMHEPGELCVKGPNVMLGYHNNPKATSEILDSEGWLRTGDMAYFDEDSHFYIKDRLKELIKVKGFQVPPAELEEVLRTHPCVNDVGVIGVPCPRAGETPIAYIVPKSGAKLTSDDVKNFLSEKVSRHKQVSEVIFLESIPKSASGKILRKDLKQLYKNNH